MNAQRLKQALNYLVDRAIPTDADPTPEVRKRLAARLRLQKQTTRSGFAQHRLRAAGLAALLVTVAGAIFLLTSPGQALAQGIIRFFTVADHDILPLPTGQPVEPPPPTRTAAPTEIIALQPVTPAANAAGAQDYPPATPGPAPTDASAPVWNLSIAAAEQLAGYTVRVPASLPPGYRLDNVTYDPQTDEVAQIYGFHPYSAGEQFILHQRPALTEAVIGQSATVEQMTIGGVAVEFVEGSWFGEAGAAAETWQTNSIHHTFRWQQGEFYFTLEILCDDQDTWSPAYWTRDGMLAMIESILGVRTEFPEQINFNHLTSIAQAERAAGFDLLVPTTLPEGFIFTRAVFDPQTGAVRLFYQPENGSRGASGVQLVILEKQGAGQFSATWEGFPQEAVETVTVGSSLGTFARGSLAEGVYQPDTAMCLVWESAGLSLELIYTTPADYPARLDEAELIAIAASMQ